MEIAIRVEGITPLICNRFGDEAALISSSGTRGASAAQDRGTPLEIATKKLYHDSTGALCIPQPNLLRCLVDGGRFHKVGKSQLTTKESSMLFACVDVATASIPLQHKQPWRVDSRPCVIPSTKGRILVHRPIFDDWALEFKVELDINLLGPALLRKVIDDAGRRVGLGDFRPARKGPYGRFVVTNWQIIEVELERAQVA